MEDLTPTAIPPAAQWEKTPSDDDRKSRKHRPPPEKPPEDEPAEIEESEPHNLDELA